MAIKIRGEEITQANWRELLNVQEHGLGRNELLGVLGQINRERKLFDKVEKYLKQTVPQFFESDEWEYSAEGFFFRRTEQTRVSLSAELVLADMGEEWVKEHSKETTYYQIDIKPVEE